MSHYYGRASYASFPLRALVPCAWRSLAGLGIAIVNDFKSIEGDRAMGLQSLPVAFGVDTAKWICASTIDVTQVQPQLLLAKFWEVEVSRRRMCTESEDGSCLRIHCRMSIGGLSDFCAAPCVVAP